MKKKHLLIPLSVLGLFSLIGCSNYVSSSSTTYSSIESSASTSIDSSTASSSDNSSIEESSEDYGSAYDYNTSIVISEETSIEVEEIEGEFKISTEDGEYSNEGSIYTIKKAGTYTLEGKLIGQILIEAGDDDEVVIELNNVSISYNLDSPIKALNASKVEISALKNTDNSITDNRSKKTTDVSSQGEGAIYSDVDLKLKGSGTLVVTGNYNNGIHTSKDLTIQKETLKITAYNNALRGKNSVTVESGYLALYSEQGNGIKTVASDVSSKGNQKGNITVNGGTIYVNSLHDAFDASYNVEINETDSTVPTTIVLKTGTKSSTYSRSSFSSSSEKGLKAANEIIINKGTVQISGSDDAIHANYGDTLENGEKGLGNITINGGNIEVASGDDGLHADNTLAITGGRVVVTGATEGYEANYINISGGYSYIYGTDDGVNCSRKSFNNCAINISGGYLDVAVSNGDTDGIDSNGNVYITGGVIVTRGGPGTTGNQMSTGLDVDYTCSMTGGTLIAFNGLESIPTTGNNIYRAATSGSSSGGFGPGGMPSGPGRRNEVAASGSSYAFQAGNYTLKGEGLEISFTNDYQYGSFMIYSASLVSNQTYTLYRNDNVVLSWVQNSSNVTIS